MPPVLAMTGATGFVGTAALETALVAGWHVRALTRKPQPPRPGVTWIAGALDNGNALESLAAGSEAFLHIAGVVTAPDRAAFDAGNALATGNVLDAVRRASIARFVHISSLAAREPDLSDYGWSKARAETIVRASGTDWTIVRPPAVFGPGDREMLDLFRMARRGIMLLPPAGRMSAIYVAELARLLIAVLADRDKSIGATYEPDDGRQRGWSHRSFAQAIGRAVGRRHVSTIAIPRHLLRLGGRLDPLVRRRHAKLTRDRARYIAHPDWVVSKGARPPAELWSPQVDTADALAETANWYRRNHWL